MKANRKLRRARAAQARRAQTASRPQTWSSSAQERAEAINAGIVKLVERYGGGDQELVNHSLTSSAAVFALGSGDSEEVFIARARTFYQEAKRSMDEIRGRIVVPEPPPLVVP
jgi:hypothetical protein